MTITRPVQLGLIEGAHDKAVGPLPLSFVHGTNADLIATVAPLYLTGSVLDVTYGRGIWWQRFKPDPFGHHDLAQDGVDFRDLPHDDASWDTVCFDPPYIAQGGTRSNVVKSQDYRERYGLTDGISEVALRQQYIDGLAECARVANTWVLAKCSDYVNGGAFILGHINVIEDARSLGLAVHDLIVHSYGRPGPGGGQIKEATRARRAHSYLLALKGASS